MGEPGDARLVLEHPAQLGGEAVQAPADRLAALRLEAAAGVGQAQREQIEADRGGSEKVLVEQTLTSGPACR